MAQDLLQTKPLTKADFYAFMSQEPEGRFEFDGEQIIDMTGGTLHHSGIGTRFVVAISRQIDEDRWMVHGPDRGVETPTTVRYPDALVIACGEPPKSRWTQAPVLIVEVLSPSSGLRDLVTKTAEYTAMSSLVAYIVADPDQPHCSFWLRDGTQRFPDAPVEVTGKGGVISIPELDLEIALSDVYRQVLRVPSGA
jgi:Uma2 family endonuclease